MEAERSAGSYDTARIEEMVHPPFSRRDFLLPFAGRVGY
jgi:hypothetical protein